jgi:serine/threonine protein kinase/thioredoxin-like negative regulator of GroEL
VAIKCPSCHIDNPETKQYCADCGTKLPSVKDARPEVTETLEAPVRELTTGSTFAGRYQIIEELGHGGMGRVYKVFDEKIKEKIALKLIKPEIASDKETLERFSNEIRLSRRIGHRNVCRMFDLGEAEGAHFITMEYVHGEDLKNMIRMSTGLTVGTVLSVGKQVCDGLAEAHTLGIVHRDLKPQNIMIDQGGNAKIMDFGIARSLRERGITGASMMIGTPEYMSPEQAEAKEVDQQSDIYSLGIILYEMATGRVPFEGETALSIAMKHKGEAPKHPKQLNANIPDDLSRAILKCLEKDKAKRYQTAADLRSELERIEKGIPTTERVVPEKRTLTSREITVKFTMKRALIPALGILGLAIAAVLVWRFWPRTKEIPVASPKPTLAVLYFKNSSGDPHLDKWKDVLPSLLINELRQSPLIKALDQNTVFGLLKKLSLQGVEKYSPEDLMNVARQGGASHLVTGEYLTSGSHFLVEMSLADSKTGQAIYSSKEDVPNAEAISDSVAGMVKKIKTALKIPEKAFEGEMARFADDVSTRNLQALQYYLEGEDLHYRSGSGSARASFEKALALDPEFCMAYALAANSCLAQRDYAKAEQYLSKAVQLKNRVSEKERFFVDAIAYLQSEETLGKAVAILKKIVERYPDFYLARYFLAFWLQADYIGDFDQDVLQWKYFIQNKIKYPFFYYQLAHEYSLHGEYEQAREIFELSSQDIEETADNHVYIAEIYLLEKKFDQALTEFEKACSLTRDDPFYRCQVGLLYFVQHDHERARRFWIELIKKKKGMASWVRGLIEDWTFCIDLVEGKLERINKHVESIIPSDNNLALADHYCWWGRLFLQFGYPQKAREKLEEALGYVEKEEARIKIKGYSQIRLRKCDETFWLAIAYIKMGDVEKAGALFKEYKGMIPDCMQKNYQPALSCLEGNIALAKRNYPQAVRDLESDVATMSKECFDHWNHSQAFDLDCLGDAYFQRGDLAKAGETYKRIFDLQGGRWEWGAIYAKAYYKMGLVYERMNDKPHAREYYTKFLDLWKDADAGLPEVPDAKARLATLKGS